MIISNVDGRAAPHQRLDDLGRSTLARADYQPAPTSPRTQTVRVLGKYPIDLVMPVERHRGWKPDAGPVVDEQLRNLHLPAHRRLVEGRHTRRILPLGVRAKREQRDQRSRLLFRYRQVQRATVPVRPIHLPVEIGWRQRGKLANGVNFAHRDGGMNGVPGAVSEQVSGDLFVIDRVEADGPTQHIQQVPRALADRVGTVLDEKPYNPDVAALRGEVQRHRVVPFVTYVRIGAAPEQQPYDGFVMNPEVERGALAGVAPERTALVDDRGVVIEQLARSQGVTAIGGGE